MVQERDAILAGGAGFGVNAARRRVTSKPGIR
jgi:hypothetical protein